MAGAAVALLGALPDDARRRAIVAFADNERFNWHYVPRGREGLPFKAMPAPARAAAHELMKASLSAAGYAKAANVIRLEAVLRQLETFGGLLRDPENYSVTVFGAPDASGAPWGWRLEGHHLSLNFTLVPGKPVAVTPAFFGANPAEVRSGPLKGLRALGREQDLGRALAQSADEAQRRRMIISAQSLGDIVSGPGRGEGLAAPAGLPAADLKTAQRGMLVQLVEEYARNMRTEIAEASLSRIREAGVERLSFAWAGPIDPGQRPLLPRPRADRADRARQHAERRQPHPLRVARSSERFRRRSLARPLPPRPPPARVTAMDTFEAIRTLLAVRRYQDRPVPEAVVRTIVEAGRLTGSAMNLQPWHFIVVQDREMLRRLGALARSGPYIADAPLAIVVAVEKTGYAVSDASRAIHSMLLAAWSEGVGSNWVGFGGLGKVNALLDIPAGLDALAILPFGYPAERVGRGVKKRKPLRAVAHRERFGLPFE